MTIERQPVRARTSYIVVCVRQDGTERAWRGYADYHEAKQAAARLCEVGCPARVATEGELTLAE